MNIVVLHCKMIRIIVKNGLIWTFILKKWHDTQLHTWFFTWSFHVWPSQPSNNNHQTLNICELKVTYELWNQQNIRKILKLCEVLVQGPMQSIDWKLNVTHIKDKISYPKIDFVIK
jgi:hypothetical protein